MTSSSPPERTPWGFVVLLGSLTAMGPLAIDMYLPSLPAIGADLHASAGQTQATVSAFLAGMGLGQFFYGPASDRLGRRMPLFFGIGVYVAASIACALAVSPEMLIGSRFVQALGACAGGVVSRAIVRDRFGHTDTARMLSLLMLIMGLAPILAPLLGGVFLGFGGWRLNFWFMTAFGVAVGLAAIIRLKETRSDETTAQAATENPLQAFAALMSLAAVTGFGERWTVLPLLVLVFTSLGFIQGNTMAGALNVDPRRAGSISALLGGVSFGTGAAASALAGLLHDGTPRPMALVMLVSLVGSALALRFLALPQRRERDAMM